MYKVFENSFWLLADKLSKLFPGIIVLALIARQLGPEDFGIWNYALALTTIIGNIAVLGMDKIAVKELVNNNGRQPQIVATILFMRISAGVAAMMLSIAIVYFAKQQAPLYMYCTVLSSLNVVLQSFDTFDYFYQARNTVKKVIIPKVGVFLAFCAIKLVFVFMDGTLGVFLWLSFLELLITYLIILAGYRRYAGSGFLRDLDLSLAGTLLREGWPLIFSNLVVVLFIKVDLLLLDMLGSPLQVGEYVVAARISELWYALPAVLSAAVLPGLVSKRNTNPDGYLKNIERWLRLCFWSSFTISLLMTSVSNVIMPLLYGAQYGQSSLILMIHIWASIPVFMCSAYVHHLIIEGGYKTTLYGNILGLVVNIGLNLLLIPGYGGVGAAIATVISYFAVYCSLVMLDRSGKGLLLTRRMMNLLLLYSDIGDVYQSFSAFARKSREKYNYTL